MSKCRESFSSIYPLIPSGNSYNVWQAAWNAATQNAADICLNESVEIIGPGDEAYNMAINHCAEAIEKEQCE